MHIYARTVFTRAYRSCHVKTCRDEAHVVTEVLPFCGGACPAGLVSPLR